MTLLAFTMVAAMMAGQQPAPLVSQTELAPPAAVQQPGPQPQADQAPAQNRPPAQFAQQQQPQETNGVPPVKPPDKKEAAEKNGTKGPGGKRVVAFWVILPDKNK